MDTLEVIDLYLRAPVLYSKPSVAMLRCVFCGQKNLINRPASTDVIALAGHKRSLV